MPKVFLIEGIDRYSDAERLRDIRSEVFEHLDHILFFKIQDEELEGASTPDEAAVVGMRHRQIVDSITSLFEVDVQFIFPGDPKPKEVISNPTYRGWCYGFLSGWVYDNGVDPGDQVHDGIVRVAPLIDFKHGVVLYHSARIQMGSTPEGEKHSTEELKKSTVLWGAYVSEGIDLQEDEDNPMRIRRHADA